MGRKYYKKRKHKRPWRKRRTNTLEMGQQMPGFPTNKIVKMRYCDIVTLNPSAGGLAVYQFRANSIFDPDFTGLGHAPIGSDQWAQFYNHYVVLGSRITCNLLYNDQQSGSGYIYGCYLSDDAIIPGTGLQICEQGLGNYGMASGNNYAPVAGKGMDNVPAVRNYYGAKKFYNIKDVKDNIVRIGAPVTANPGDTAIYTVWQAGVDPLTDLQDTKVLVTIEYNVLYSEPKSLPQS